jgi:hypothetical protein
MDVKKVKERYEKIARELKERANRLKENRNSTNKKKAQQFSEIEEKILSLPFVVNEQSNWFDDLTFSEIAVYLQMNIGELETMKIRDIIKFIGKFGILNVLNALEQYDTFLAKRRAWNKKLSKDNSCIICMDKEIDCVFVECGHMISCSECSENVITCPFCRVKIYKCIKVYKK